VYGPGEKWANLNDYIDWMMSQAKGEPQPGPVDVIEMRGDLTTYQGAMGWDKFGSDVAPQLSMCSEIATRVNFDQISIDIIVNPDTGTISGKFSGNGSETSTYSPGKRDEGSFEGFILSGRASRLEGGYWDFSGSAEVDLNFYDYTICVGDPSDIGMALDAGAKEVVTANVFGNTYDGACIWWSELFPNGDVKRDFYLQTTAIQALCQEAISRGTTP
jgi:hypothetical protein